MKTLQCALVGMHFRPPAQLVLSQLPLGTELWLEREPENPYDAMAVKVLCAPSDLPEPANEEEAEEWEARLAASGSSSAELAAQPLLQLGYLGASAKLIEPGQIPNSVVAERLDRGDLLKASLTASLSGKPSVKIIVVQEAGGQSDVGI